MATSVQTSNTGTSLVKVQVYLHPEQRQLLREMASRRGLSMSEYVKQLVARDRRDFEQAGRS